MELFSTVLLRNLRWKSIDRYAVGQFDGKGFEVFNRPMFRQIKESFDPEVIRKNCQTTNSGTPQVVILCCRVTEKTMGIKENRLQIR